MIVLSVVFMVMTFVVFVFYGAFAGKVRIYVLGSPSILEWLKRSFAAAFVLLAARLAVQGSEQRRFEAAVGPYFDDPKDICHGS